jgi:twinfilin-like protein
MSLLPSTLPSPKTPASFAYRLDSKEMGKYEWMMITFVPDDAGVSHKSTSRRCRADKPSGPSKDAPGVV